MELDHPDLSVRKQCRFLEVNRSSILYKPRQMSDLNEQLVELVMEIFEHAPYLGYRRVTELIREEHGLIINHKRVRRIMSELGLHSIKPRQISGGSKWITRKYSDLVEGIALDHPNQVWTSDITHIRLKGGWIYVVAIRDCYSKKILSWEHSYRIEPMFYVQALNKALTHYGSPEIFHAYEESLCTTELFLGNLEKKRIKISIDQNKKVKGSVLIEKFWRSIKDSRIEAKEESSENSLLKIVEDWVAFYNQSRPESMNHSHTPEEVYRGDQIHDGILRKKGICESSPWHLIPDGEEDQLPENLRDLEPVYSRYSLEKFEKTRG
ncbi:IS3 family transposase [bacterium]|nr:IS3 family transposase [bacterium]